MSESEKTEPGCLWAGLFFMIFLALTGISLTIGRVATALERIATAAEHHR